MIVVKIGGSEGIDLDRVADDVAALRAKHERLVLVHGGSAETNRVAEALGHPPRFLTSPSGYTSRYTDKRTIEIFEMVYCGKVNKAVVESLRAAGVDAVGLSGIDAGIWTGKRKNAIRAVDEEGRTFIIRDDLTGRVELAARCAELGLDRERHDLLMEILLLDADHAETREALGFQRYTGPVARYQGNWLTPDELARLEMLSDR